MTTTEYAALKRMIAPKIVYMMRRTVMAQLSRGQQADLRHSLAHDIMLMATEYHQKESPDTPIIEWFENKSGLLFVMAYRKMVDVARTGGYSVGAGGGHRAFNRFSNVFVDDVVGDNMCDGGIIESGYGDTDLQDTLNSLPEVERRIIDFRLKGVKVMKMPSKLGIRYATMYEHIDHIKEVLSDKVHSSK